MARGDTGLVKKLAEQNGNLLVFKDNAILAYYINAYTETWIEQVLSTRDGCSSPYSVVTLPNGDIGFADTNHFKLIKNLQVFPVTLDWDDVYSALTTSAIVSWYDKIDRTLNFTTGSYASKTHYKGFLDYAFRREDGLYCVPWFPVLTVTDGTEFVCVLRDSTVVFTNSAATKTFKWGSGYTLFGSDPIKPYLASHEMILDETMLAIVDRVMIVRTYTGSLLGTLQCQIFVDSDTVTSEVDVPVGEQAKTNIMVKTKPTEVRSGRKIKVIYNNDASPEYAGTMALHGIYVYGTTEKPRALSR